MVAGWAERRDWPLHAHLSEQPAENEACIAAHGRRPTAVLADAGALSERFTAVHFTHVSGQDIGLLGERRCHCCLCPTTERDLADGVGRARAIADAGARLDLGSDSHAVIDQFEEMRAVELDQRLVTGERGHHDAAGCCGPPASRGTRASAGPTPGESSPARSPTWSRSISRAFGSRAPAPNARWRRRCSPPRAADVRRVVALGRPVVDEGRHVGMDVAAELRASIAALDDELFSHSERNSS